MSLSVNPMKFVQSLFTEVLPHKARSVSGAVLEFLDTGFYVVDPSDTTKRVRIDAGAVTTATDVTLTVNDAGLTLTGLRSVVDTGGAYATPIVLTAADSGKTYLLDDAAGLDFTMPTIAAANIGMNFRFVLQTEVTSNAYRFTAEATDLYLGAVIIVDKDMATGDTNALLSVFRPDLSNDVILTIAGADDTKGSLVGGWLEFEAITASRWFVRGVLIGDGALATIFS